jgi:HAD superfamily hydrolase (TIGR01509 family)
VAVELTLAGRCVLFDCDGTIVDSELLGNVALARELACSGIVENGESLTERFRGQRLADILVALQATHGTTLPAGFVDAYRERAAATFEARVVPIPGVEAALATLGLPMCIVSNGPIAKIRQSLRVCGLAAHFGDRLFSAYDVDSWKPDPGLFLHAARAMGFAPADCVVVDDGAPVSRLRAAQACERFGSCRTARLRSSRCMPRRFPTWPTWSRYFGADFADCQGSRLFPGDSCDKSHSRHPPRLLLRND